ncbi:hypothetical protein NDU88_002510 [Pleurodeles waltl]|uniref:Uncharacterized protein n=1 Tax=Pleurodeles waltl TaxID=8319 RepID=A0AAV7T2M2_PLEWA|nr:hypothetical protein NDU88_002510 [Pleurodeles waltl]
MLLRHHRRLTIHHHAYECIIIGVAGYGRRGREDGAALTLPPTASMAARLRVSLLFGGMPAAATGGLPLTSGTVCGGASRQKQNDHHSVV